MIYSLNPPLRVPHPTACDASEYAYYRVVADELRPAKAVGKWADVWSRVDAAERELNQDKPG